MTDKNRNIRNGSRSDPTIPFVSFFVMAEYDLNANDGYEQKLPIEKVIPQYVSHTSDYDVALVKFRSLTHLHVQQPCKACVFIVTQLPACHPLLRHRVGLYIRRGQFFTGMYENKKKVRGPPSRFITIRNFKHFNVNEFRSDLSAHMHRFM